MGSKWVIQLPKFNVNLMLVPDPPQPTVQDLNLGIYCLSSRSRLCLYSSLETRLLPLQCLVKELNAAVGAVWFRDYLCSAVVGQPLELYIVIYITRLAHR